MDQAELYDAFMPQRVQAFLDGINVNIMAYGQTGSGKTHTVFGPPGIMARAAAVNKKALPGQKLTTTGGAEDGGQSALASFKEAFSRGYRRDMFLLLLIWFVNAFAYYGLVLMTTELSMVRQENGRYHPDFQNVTDTGGCDNLFDTSFYSEIFIASFAEVPGLILAMLLVDRLGRKLSQAVFYFGCCLPVLILALVPRTSAGDTMLLFVARGASQGGFTVLYLYTPERFPTRFRSTAMGMCFAFARFGGMICPFVSQDMVERGEVTGALVILAVTLLTAGVCSLLLTVETKGLELDAVAPAQQQQQQPKQGGFQNLMEEAGDGQDTA